MLIFQYIVNTSLNSPTITIILLTLNTYKLVEILATWQVLFGPTVTQYVHKWLFMKKLLINIVTQLFNVPTLISNKTWMILQIGDICMGFDHFLLHMDRNVGIQLPAQNLLST